MNSILCILIRILQIIILIIRKLNYHKKRKIFIHTTPHSTNIVHIFQFIER